MQALISLLMTGGLAMTFIGPANAENAYSGFLDDYKNARVTGKTSHAVMIDNDTLLMNRNDGFYSSGMRYIQESSVRSDTKVVTYGWRIGQELYTASDIKLAPEQIGRLDHPYAGWIYAGLFKETHDSDGRRVSFGLDLGCLGPCAGGEWTQTRFHKLIDQPEPRGWDKQMRNEAGAVLHGEWAPGRWRWGHDLDIAPSVKGRLGNLFTDVGTEVVVRAGRLNILPDQPTLHAYLRTGLTAVVYNATLQGGLFSSDNPHTVKPRRLVGEAEIGVAWLRGRYQAGLGVVRRSSEIRGLPASIGAQNYVRLHFVYTP